nr:hypothetical protein [uncultured Mucilaginibacter sp.]
MPWWCELAATVLIAAMVIMMIVNLVKLVIAVFKNRRQLNVYYFYPIVVYIAVICAPIGAWEDHLSAVKFRACYEGANSQTTINFRQDHTFELNATGVFFFNRWEMGNWVKSGDTLTLKWDKKPAKALGNTVLIDSGYLKPLGESADSQFRQRPLFYLGYCKGEN